MIDQNDLSVYKTVGCEIYAIGPGSFNRGAVRTKQPDDEVKMTKQVQPEFRLDYLSPELKKNPPFGELFRA